MTFFNPAFYSQPAAGLLQGTKWGGTVGQGVQLTWSFASLSSSFLLNYSGSQEYTAMTEFSASEKAVVTDAMVAWTTLCGLSAVLVEDNANIVGELRFARTDNGDPDEAAHAYYPSNHPTAGDIWMKNGQWHNGYYNEVVKGSYDYVTLLHEIGHALGLKHSFEGPNAMPDQYDSYLYTIMSYESKAGTNSNYASFYPTTPMYLDIVAMQILYGVDSATRTGNTIYTYNQGNRYFETIYDAGGSDTIVYNGSTSVTINLNIGSFSSISDPIFFGDNSSSRSTVCIGPNTIIERAAGGSGSDPLFGNAVANALIGNAGHDALYGNAGNDSLSGGNGNDRMVGGTGSDTAAGGAGNDISTSSARWARRMSTPSRTSTRSSTRSGSTGRFSASCRPMERWPAPRSGPAPARMTAMTGSSTTRPAAN